MLEEITPQALASAMVMVLIASTALTLLLSVALLLRYRRAVLRAMAASSATPTPLAAPDGVRRDGPARTAPSPDDPASAECDGPRAHSRLRRAPWEAAIGRALAGLAFALVTVVALLTAFSATARWFDFGVLLGWVVAWPIVLGLALGAPGGMRTGLAAAGIYALPLLAFTLADLLDLGQPSPSTPAEWMAMASRLTPPGAALAWLIGNGAPTALFLVFMNRRLRAVAPLVLAFTTVVMAALVGTLVGLMTRRGSDAARWAALASGTDSAVILLGGLLLVLVIGAACGVVALMFIRRGYLRKRLNDRSLAFDALWLLFAACHALAFAFAGVGWVAAPVVAFAAYRGTWQAWLACMRVRRPDTEPRPRPLLFLRVFSLGRRSDALFDAAGRRWRHIGSVQVITGPDLAHSTVQPHQMLDFIVGRLRRHFVADAASLERALRERDLAPDRDGLFRVNSFFCHADTWEAAFARLAAAGGAVLMDLRSFAPTNAGCVRELRYLVDAVPLSRCVFVVDKTTNRAFLGETLEAAFGSLRADSPNAGRTPEAAALHAFDGGERSLAALAQRLCSAA